MTQDPWRPCWRRSHASVTFRCPPVVAVGCLLLCTIWGCGTGDYEQRLQSRTEKSQAQAQFNQLNAPQPLEGTTVSVRLPRVFQAKPMSGGKGKGEQQRFKPPQVTLLGLKLTYEAFIKDATGGQLPYYCYVGAVDIADAQAKDLDGKLRGELASKPGNESLSDWQNFQAETPDGQASSWKKLRCVAPQEFAYSDSEDQVRFLTMPGVLEIYLHEEGGFLVFVAWRLPKSIEPNVDLAKWAPLVAGCVSVQK